MELDNKQDVFSVGKLELKVGSESAQIYANGKNELPILIHFQPLNKDGKPLNFHRNTYLEMLSLRFAENDEKLNYEGDKGWCYRDYTKEFPQNNEPPSISRDGTVSIKLYLYSYEVGTKRIAVGVDTESKHFTTADQPSGAQKMSVTIEAVSN